MINILDLFSGIGGFTLGLEQTGGFQAGAFCEIEEFPRQVLRKHWPDVPVYHDVKDLTGERLVDDFIRSEILTAGFPCQDISLAGAQRGMGPDTRSGLWAEACRILGEVKPRYAIFENVSALLSGGQGAWFHGVLDDLAALRYSVEWHAIPASSIGAWHKRDRVWILATERGASEGRTIMANAYNKGLQRCRESRPVQERQGAARHCRSRCTLADWSRPDGSRVPRVSDGIPRRVDRLKSIGNAIVPQMAELIGYGILEHEAIRRGVEIVGGMHASEEALADG